MGWVEKILGKRENFGNLHIFLFLQCFQKASFVKVVRGQRCFIKG